MLWSKIMNNIIWEIHLKVVNDPKSAYFSFICHHMRDFFFLLNSILFQFVDVIIKPEVGGSLSGADWVTLTRLNHHHHPADDLAVFAQEADRWRLSSVGSAASPIRAGPTVSWLELLQATAACMGQFNWTTGLLCVDAFLILLQERRHQKHVSNNTWELLVPFMVEILSD